MNSIPQKVVLTYTNNMVSAPEQMETTYTNNTSATPQQMVFDVNTSQIKHTRRCKSTREN